MQIKKKVLPKTCCLAIILSLFGFVTCIAKCTPLQIVIIILSWKQVTSRDSQSWTAGHRAVSNCFISCSVLKDITQMQRGDLLRVLISKAERARQLPTPSRMYYSCWKCRHTCRMPLAVAIGKMKHTASLHEHFKKQGRSVSITSCSPSLRSQILLRGGI
jgi:hypothetical protein